MVHPRVVIPSAEQLHATIHRCDELAQSPETVEQAPALRLCSLVAGYSLGEGTARIAERYEAWFEALKASSSLPLRVLSYDQYVSALWLLSLTRVLAPERIEDAVALVDDVDVDPILCAISQRESSHDDTLVQPAFADLARTLRAKSGDVRRQLAVYLAGYTDRFAGVVWSRVASLGVESAGCWSFEVLALFGENEHVMPFLAGSRALPDALLPNGDEALDDLAFELEEEPTSTERGVAK